MPNLARGKEWNQGCQFYIDLVRFGLISSDYCHTLLQCNNFPSYHLWNYCVLCHISLVGVGCYSTSYNSFSWLLPLHLRQGQTSHSMEVTVTPLTYSDLFVKQPSYWLRWFRLALKFLSFCKLNMYPPCMVVYTMLPFQYLMLHNESTCMPGSWTYSYTTYRRDVVDL